MRQRQDEVLGVRVHHAEGEFVVMELAMHGVALEVIERVVHPAHVPFHRETQPARIHGPADHGPVGGFLGHGDGAGRARMRHCVQRAQEFHRLQVFAAAMAVRDEVRAAREIQVEHRGHGVHAQPVEVVFLQPVAGAGQQEALHLVALVIEDVRAPVLVLALARVFIFIERRAVETGEAMRIARKMRRHPVEQHADAGAMAAVDEVLQVIRRRRSGWWARSSRWSDSPRNHPAGVPTPAAVRCA